MSIVTEILTTDQIHDLWGAGYTIVRRPADPFEIDKKLIPHGMSYQWNEAEAKLPGWKPVPFSRHEGVFAPYGCSGDIFVGGLSLCEKARAEVEVELKRNAARAQQNVEDWATRTGAQGITGGARVVAQDSDGRFEIVKETYIGKKPVLAGDAVVLESNKTIETTVGIPRDMTPHIASIFKERDRLEAEVVRKDRTLAPGPIADKFYAAVDADKGAPWWPTLRAILLPIAVDNVRASLKKDETNDD